jgi:hypothetical protein
MIRTAAIVVGSIALCGLAGCPTVDLGEDPSNPAVCRPDPMYFRTEMWPNYIKTADTAKSCVDAASCHREADGRSGLRFDPDPGTLPDGVTLDTERNYQVAIRFLNCSSRDASTLFTRPLGGQDSHGGGDIFEPTDPQVDVFRGWF